MKYLKTWIPEAGKKTGSDRRPLPKFKIYQNIIDLKNEYGENPNEIVFELRRLNAEDIERIFEAKVKEDQEFEHQMQEVVDVIQQDYNQQKYGEE